MARPRTIDDPEALDRARACIVEHGPGVSLAVLSRAIGLSPPALIKRFGSKERLLFRALLPAAPPRWAHTLATDAGEAPMETLVDVLCELCDDFRSVGPALAALRMSPLEVDRMFPPDQLGPAGSTRRRMAQWLDRAGCDRSPVLAEMLVGAAEARGFLTWVGPQLLSDSRSDAEWATDLARFALGAR